MSEEERQEAWSSPSQADASTDTDAHTPLSPVSAQSAKRSRPLSMIAQSFAVDLDAMFGLGPTSESVNTLSHAVEEKKKTVSSGQSELEQLEARLRATEERLAKVSRNGSPARSPPPIPRINEDAEEAEETSSSKPTNRLANASAAAGRRLAHRPAAVGRDEYVMVESSG